MTNQSEKIDLLATALAKAQENMGRAVKDKSNNFYKSKYADLGSIMDACMRVLNAESISVTQLVSNSEGNAYLVTRLMHSSGQFIESSCPLYVDKSKQPMHALGSAITYARRYGLAAICGVAQEDDDGNAIVFLFATAKIRGVAIKQRVGDHQKEDQAHGKERWALTVIE